MYNLTDIPSDGMIQTPLYRISSTTGDPGADYTHNNIIHTDATIILSGDDNYLIIQNYGSDDDTLNNLVALDLSSITGLSGELNLVL